MIFEVFLFYYLGLGLFCVFLEGEGWGGYLGDEVGYQGLQG